MKHVFVLLAVVGLILLSGCVNLFGPTPEDQAKNLVKSFLDDVVKVSNAIPETIPEATDTNFKTLAGKFIHFKSNEWNDSNVREGTAELMGIVRDFLTRSGTPTSISVLGVDDTGVKIPHLVSNPPTHVSKVYTMNLLCTNASTKTTVSLPMIVVDNSPYFYTVYIKTTDSSTDITYYPKIELAF